DRGPRGLPHVGDDRKAQLAGQTHLLAEALALELAQGVVVAVVQPDLAVGDDAFGFRERTQLVIPVVLDVLHFVRVDADGGGDERMLLRQFHSGAARLEVATDRHEMPDPAVARALEHPPALGVKPRVVDMAVAVDLCSWVQSHIASSLVGDAPVLAVQPCEPTSETPYHDHFVPRHLLTDLPARAPPAQTL